MSFVYAILVSDGELKAADIYKECRAEQWVPIACYQKDSKPTVLLANSAIIADNFAKRNFPRHWVRGSVRLTEEYFEIIKNNGWDYEILNFPRKIPKNLEFVVLNLIEEPFYNCAKKK